MKKGLLNQKEIEPACKLCSHGILSADGESVLCVKTGIRQLDSKCRSFKYDPLKRVPQRRKQTQEFSPEDFQL